MPLPLPHASCRTAKKRVLTYYPGKSVRFSLEEKLRPLRYKLQIPGPPAGPQHPDFFSSISKLLGHLGDQVHQQNGLRNLDCSLG